MTCVQQKLKRKGGKGDGGENVQEEKTRMTSELAAHPSASQSLQQHEYQSGAADRQNQMKKREEEWEQGLRGNDEAVKGNNCRCIFFFKSSWETNPCKCDVSAQSETPERSLMKAAWFVHRSLISHAGIVLGTRRTQAVCEAIV